MTLRLTASAIVLADPARVWDELTDWAGQRRWIPLTTVRVSGRSTGIGVRADALSGFWLGRWPIGLLDRFVVTDWTVPGEQAGRLEVLHLGPYFTGPGAFTVTAVSAGARVDCIELFELPGGRLTETPARLLLPLMSGGFAHSLRRLAGICEK